MNLDKKRIYIISSIVFVTLLVALFIPFSTGRIIGSILLAPATLFVLFFIKKRKALSINTNQIIMLMAVIGIVYVTLYYLSALYFGFTKTGYGLKLDIIFTLTIPIAIIIVCTELIRHVLVVQDNKIVSIIAYFICLISDILICSNISDINTVYTFMDIIGLTLFPGIIYNLLFNYLSKRYGFIPNIIYRVLTVLIFYLIPYGSAISDSLVSFINMILPIGIFYFIDSLYEPRKKYALGEQSVFKKNLSRVLNIAFVIIMIGFVMLISNQFKYGSYVVATESMTGELNKGDMIIYESYDDQIIIEGQVIVFESNKAVTIHRVAKIEIINGVTRYYTKGDANEDMDSGYITESNIIGLVNYKVPVIGFPTIWVHNLFKR